MIRIRGFFDYFFFDGDERQKEGCCELCKVPVDERYISIIHSLKKEGLLNSNFPILCCGCRAQVKTLNESSNFNGRKLFIYTPEIVKNWYEENKERVKNI